MYAIGPLRYLLSKDRLTWWKAVTIVCSGELYFSDLPAVCLGRSHHLKPAGIPACIVQGWFLQQQQSHNVPDRVVDDHFELTADEIWPIQGQGGHVIG